MRSKLSALGFVLILSALILSGCAPSTVQPTESPKAVESEVCVDKDTGARLSYQEAVEIAQSSECLEQGQLKDTHVCNENTGTWWLDLDIDKPGCMPACVIHVADRTAEINWRCTGAILPEATVEQPATVPTATPTEAAVEAPDPARARDAALAYLSEHYGEQAPPSGLTWTEERTTPEGLVGSSTFEYTAENWVVTVSFPIVAPENVVYQVVVANQTTGFQWEGEVDAAGQVTEMAAPKAAAEAEGDFQPLNPAACSDLAKAMAKTLGVEVATAEAPFQDYIGGKSGIGCQATATGSGLDFENFPSVAQDLKGMLDSQGWQEEISYAADGPTGTASGFRKGDGLCLLNVGWKPSEDAECPTDQPISACELAPEQKLYTIVLNCASVPPPTDWAEVDEGLLVYTNDVYGYQFRYPAGATLTETGVEGFPSDELPEGMSPDEYMAQLQEKYTDKLCVHIEYGLGYIYISAPPNQGHWYAACGRTGVGAGEIINKTEDVTLGGQSHTAVGFEFIGGGETLEQHNETFRINLADGTVIEYGARPEPTASYQDYLMKGKPMLLRILASYSPTAGR
jgi:hypothetical protein